MPANLKTRVRKSAKTVLDRDKSISPIELLVELGFLHFSHVRQWKIENPHYADLESHIQCGEKKLKQTWSEFFAWVQENKLETFAADYTTTSRAGSIPLRVSGDGNAKTEKFFRTHFRRSDLTEKQKLRITKKQTKAPDLMVFQQTGDSSACSECSETLRKGDLFLLEQQEPICLECADMAHLEFLPSGDATLTRRARKHSPLSAIVTRFDSRRKRYQRQGVLVTSESIDAAHAQNAGDMAERAIARQKAAERRSKQDQQLAQAMTSLIRHQYPGCPPEEAEQIAQHTAERGSGRVGRSAAGRSLNDEAIALAVFAWVRHQHTVYDELLMSGVERQAAREQIRDTQHKVLARWRSGS